jgi:hypothetical protein
MVFAKMTATHAKDGGKDTRTVLVPCLSTKTVWSGWHHADGLAFIALVLGADRHALREFERGRPI